MTRRKAKANFHLPEFSLTKSISWICHVDQITDPGHALYDMIIGSNLMEELGIYLLYSQSVMT
jgi:hypothetical protein